MKIWKKGDHYIFIIDFPNLYKFYFEANSVKFTHIQEREHSYYSFEQNQWRALTAGEREELKFFCYIMQEFKEEIKLEQLLTHPISEVRELAKKLQN